MVLLQELMVGESFLSLRDGKVYCDAWCWILKFNLIREAEGKVKGSLSLAQSTADAF